MAQQGKVVRIGGGSGFWGDSSLGPAQLFAVDGLDYVVLDYLAEVTMSILAKAKSRDPEAGYATDFIAQVIRPHIHTIAEERIKVVTNAGGLNLDACRRALEQVAAEAGVELTVGTVSGDDVSGRLDGLRDRIRELDSGAPLPEKIMSANAYLGAFPIAAALGSGADIVVTGRCVDSALVLGPLIHEFGWSANDLDQLAGASLAGHLIECGAQATGGNFTDWEETADDWETTGFPIAEVESDGSFVLTKPEGTGGQVSPLTAAEQMVYEIGDPRRYILPDVVCDFSQVTMAQAGADRVRIEGAKGTAPTDTLKVCATYSGGYACVGSFVVAGQNAPAKARRQGEAVLRRTGRMLAERQLPPYSHSALQVIGSESLYGNQANPALSQSREVVLRLAVQHPSSQGADLFSREFIGAALSMAPGLALIAPGRPKPSPVVRLYSFLIDKAEVAPQVLVAGKQVLFEQPSVSAADARAEAVRVVSDSLPKGASAFVPLRKLAVARSGDKGDKANIGVIARDPRYFPWIRAALTPEAVGTVFAHVARGHVERFDLPGTSALNFLLHEALGGGGAASINLDPQAKTYAQVILDMPIAVPAELVRAST